MAEYVHLMAPKPWEKMITGNGLCGTAEEEEATTGTSEKPASNGTPSSTTGRLVMGSSSWTVSSCSGEVERCQLARRGDDGGCVGDCEALGGFPRSEAP